MLMRLFHVKQSHQHFACFMLESRKVEIILVLDPHEAEDADLLGFRQVECDNSAVLSPYTTIRVTIHEEVSWDSQEDKSLLVEQSIFVEI